MNNWLKRANTAAILLVGAGAFYQLVVSRPATPEAMWGRQGVGTQLMTAPSGNQPALEHCGEAAVLLHDISWASACMLEAQEVAARHAECLRDGLVMNNPQLGRKHCDKEYGLQDDSAECTLPSARAAALNALLKAAEDKCLDQARTAKAPG